MTAAVATNRSSSKTAPPRQFALHGLALELRCDVPSVAAEIEQLLGLFACSGWPEGFVPVTGSVEKFDPSVVQRQVSPAALRFQTGSDLLELYQDGERFWVVDERWGMTELNLLRGRWRSWLLPRPDVDPSVCAETAVLWPLAQLLRLKGLHLLPAVSVAKDGWGALILSPFGIEPELSALARNGYRIVGQRWTGVREEDGRIALLHMPGWVERSTAPRLRYLGIEPSTGRLDLAHETSDAFANHAFCDVALITEPGRRPQAHLRELGHTAAVNVLRRAWPLVDLHPQRRTGQLAPRLASHCRCAELQLSRDPQDLLRLLEGFRPRPAPATALLPTSSATQLVPEWQYPQSRAV